MSNIPESFKEFQAESSARMAALPPHVLEKVQNYVGSLMTNPESAKQMAVDIGKAFGECDKDCDDMLNRIEFAEYRIKTQAIIMSSAGID